MSDEVRGCVVTKVRRKEGGRGRKGCNIIRSKGPVVRAAVFLLLGLIWMRWRGVGVETYQCGRDFPEQG